MSQSDNNKKDSFLALCSKIKSFNVNKEKILKNNTVYCRDGFLRMRRTVKFGFGYQCLVMDLIWQTADVFQTLYSVSSCIYLEMTPWKSSYS